MRNLILLSSLLFLLPTCRLSEFIVQFRTPPTAVAQARSSPTPTPTATPSLTPLPTETPGPTDTPFGFDTVTPFPVPTEFSNPGDFSGSTPLPTRPGPAPATQPPVGPQPPASTPVPARTATATFIPPTPTPEFYYRVSYSYCGPNRYQTFVEGTVYDNGAPKNGVLVRMSQGPDGLPDPNPDYKTGTDRTRPGYYFQAIDVRRPHGGLWYLWVIDPTTMKRISTIAIVKTDWVYQEDTDTSAGSCQDATVDFSNQGIVTTPPTPRASPLPTVTGTPRTATPTVTGTPPTATPTVTGTPPTATPTPTGTLATPTKTPRAYP